MCITTLALASMIPSGDENGNLQICTPQTQQIALASPQQARCDPPITQKPLPPDLSLIRQTFTSHNISMEAKDITTASYHTSTVLPVKGNQSSVENGKDFLATLFASGLGYSTINTARSALSVFVLPNNITSGTHPLVARFLKSIFELKPTLPSYSSIWYVSVVLEHLQTLGPLTQLDLKTLTKKTMLLFVNGPVMSDPQEA